MSEESLDQFLIESVERKLGGAHRFRKGTRVVTSHDIVRQEDGVLYVEVPKGTRGVVYEMEAHLAGVDWEGLGDYPAWDFELTPVKR